MKFTDVRKYLDEHPWLDRWVVNKYTITCLIFGVFFFFIGDQSLVKQIKRVRQAHRLEKQIDEVTENNVEYTVTSVIKNRIGKIRITIVPVV